MTDDVDADLVAGARLYEDGEYFEAHEVWEHAWHDAQGHDRDLLHGLIQTAAAYVNLRRGNPAGVERLAERALDRLAEVPDGHRGVDVEAVRAQNRENARRARAALDEGRTLVLRRPSTPWTDAAPHVGDHDGRS